jgi:hypothetical protein
MATARSDDLESIRYSEQDPTTGGPENIRPGTLEKLKEMFQRSPKDKDGKVKETGAKPKVRQEQIEQDIDRYDIETVMTGITGAQVELPLDLLQVDPECPQGDDDGASQDADVETDNDDIQEVYTSTMADRRIAGTDAASGRDLYPEVIEAMTLQVPRRQYRDAGTGTSRDRSIERPAREPIRNLLPGNQGTGTGNIGAGGGGQGPPNPNPFSGYYGPTRTQDAFNAFNANIARHNASTPENSLYEDENTGSQGRGIATLLSHIVKPVKKTLTSKIDREDERLLERADRHLRKVTTNAVQDAVDYDLRDLLALVQHLNASVQRLEKNERVSSTALCSKVNKQG